MVVWVMVDSQNKKLSSKQTWNEKKLAVGWWWSRIIYLNEKKEGKIDQSITLGKIFYCQKQINPPPPPPTPPTLPKSANGRLEDNFCSKQWMLHKKWSRKTRHDVVWIWSFTKRTLVFGKNWLRIFLSLGSSLLTWVQHVTVHVRERKGRLFTPIA